MKGILIDPYSKSINEVFIKNKDDNKEFCVLLNCTTFNTMLLETILSEEEYLLDGLEISKIVCNVLYMSADNTSSHEKNTKYCGYNLIKYNYSGRGLLFTQDDKYNLRETSLTVKDVESLITWIPSINSALSFTTH